MKKVTIIMPAFNAEKTIEESIKSVINQSYKNYELIIIDDGSNDTTKEICNKYVCEKIIYCYQNNKGVSAARNLGIKLSSGYYMTFLDSDDLYRNNYLNEMVNKIEKSKTDMVISEYECFQEANQAINLKRNYSDNDIQYIIEGTQKELLFNQLWNKIYKTSIIKTNNIIFDESIELGEDAIFNIEYISYIYKISTLKKILYRYRVTDKGLGFKYRKNAAEIKYNIFSKLNNLYDNRNFNKEYIYFNFIKQGICWNCNILDERNDCSLKSKLKEFDLLKKNKIYIDNINFAKSSKKISIKLMAIILKKSTFLLIFISYIVSKIDRRNKKVLMGK